MGTILGSQGSNKKKERSHREVSRKELGLGLQFPHFWINNGSFSSIPSEACVQN
jgi:hypothetical protein